MVTNTFASIFRNYVVDGNSATGANKPSKAEIRLWGTEFEMAVDSHGADIVAASTINLDTATGSMVDVTGSTTITAVTLANGKERWVRFTGTPQITVGASLIGNGGGANIVAAAGDIAVFRGYAAGVVRFVLFRLSGLGVVTTAPPGGWISYGQIINGTIAETNAANATTYSLKTLAGATPSATDPVVIAFRNATAATGDYVYRTVTAALTLTISSGSTLGFTSAIAGRLWIVIFDDAGTLRLGAINCLSGTNIYPLGRTPLASSTAEGGAGAADSAHVFYTGVAVSSKPYVILAYAEYASGLATAGLWNVSPSLLQLAGQGTPLPGQSIQVQENYTGAVATGTTVIPEDDTIPQITEGTQFMTQAITPVFAGNVLRISHLGNYAVSGSSEIGVALFQDATAGALAAMSGNSESGNRVNAISLNWSMKAGTISSTTFRIRAGPTTGTMTFNGISAARRFGGVLSSFLRVEEIRA